MTKLSLAKAVDAIKVTTEMTSINELGATLLENLQTYVSGIAYGQSSLQTSFPTLLSSTIPILSKSDISNDLKLVTLSVALNDTKINQILTSLSNQTQPTLLWLIQEYHTRMKTPLDSLSNSLPTKLDELVTAFNSELDLLKEYKTELKMNTDYYM